MIMKYFKDITTPEELKKQFRAYCVTMHPDKGGNAEEFKAMLNEYEQAAKNCGAWTKETREEVQGVRRGLRVVFFGAGMMETRYIITSVQGDNIKLVRIFSHDFRSLEDVENYLGGEWSDEDSRRELNKYDHIRPLSKKFGIGYYWDDVENHTYTEKEISEAERIADNFDRWAANWKANKEEEERRAQEEADREESAIIAEWSTILEKLPEEYKRPEGLSWYDMTSEQREAEKAAVKKSKSARLAAFKRNLKAVFNHFWPGVKCSFKISRSVYGKGEITWTDGPTVAEVEQCEVFDYFRAYFFESDQFSDYGDVKHRTYLNKFRQMFGAFDCDDIDFTRKLSEKTADKVRQIIADNFPEAEEARKEAEARKNDYAGTVDFSNADLSKLCALLGFARPAVPDWATASDEEKEAYHEACKPCDEFARRVRNSGLLCNNEPICLYYCTLLKWFAEYYRIEAEPTAEPKTETADTDSTDSTEPKEQPEQPTAEEVERVTRFAALLADVIRTFEEVATAAQKEAQRAKETATKQAEAEQLRADFAKMSAQVAAMSEQLRTMAERLATIEAEANAESHTDTQTADNADNEPQPETEAQERPERGEGKPDPLGMLRAAAEDVARLTEANDHTAALLARLYVLAAVGLRVRPLIQRAKAIEAAQQRGHLTPDEAADRQRISQEAERRAALLLTAEEFRTLYGYDPKTDSKAA